jgi:hypothetical protein
MDLPSEVADFRYGLMAGPRAAGPVSFKKNVKINAVGRNHEGGPGFHGAKGAALDARHLHIAGDPVTGGSQATLHALSPLPAP